VIFGAGLQARAHVDALTLIRPIERVVVVTQTAERGQAFVDELQATGLNAALGDPPAVAYADIVCCCTTAAQPLFSGDWLTPGTHVTAIGAYQPHTREIDTTAVLRAKIVVEERAAALEEAGDLIIPLSEGAWTPESIVADLPELLRGARVRLNRDDITLFKSVGVAFEDLILAAAAYQRAAR
jgi:ornithine cyclodeaminase